MLLPWFEHGTPSCLTGCDDPTTTPEFFLVMNTCILAAAICCALGIHPRSPSQPFLLQSMSLMVYHRSKPFLSRFGRFASILFAEVQLLEYVYTSSCIDSVSVQYIIKGFSCGIPSEFSPKRWACLNLSIKTPSISSTRASSI